MSVSTYTVMRDVNCCSGYGKLGRYTFPCNKSAKCALHHASPDKPVPVAFLGNPSHDFNRGYVGCGYHKSMPPKRKEQEACAA